MPDRLFSYAVRWQRRFRLTRFWVVNQRSFTQDSPCSPGSVSHSQTDAAEELLTVACELAKQKASPSAAYTAMGMMPTLLKAARKTHADATRIAMLLCNGMAYTGPLVKSPLLPATCNAAVGELMEERLLPSTLEQRAKESFDANQQKNAEWLLCDPKTQTIHPMTVHKEWTRRCAEKPVLEL